MTSRRQSIVAFGTILLATTSPTVATVRPALETPIDAIRIPAPVLHDHLVVAPAFVTTATVLHRRAQGVPFPLRLVPQSVPRERAHEPNEEIVMRPAESPEPIPSTAAVVWRGLARAFSLRPLRTTGSDKSDLEVAFLNVASTIHKVAGTTNG